MVDLLANVAQIAAAITAVIAVCGVLSKFKPARWLWRQIVAHPVAEWFRDEVLDEIEPRLGPIRDDLEVIKGELQHNGGSTVKDAVHRMERSIEDLHNKQRDDSILRDDRQHEVDERMGRFEKALERIEARP